MNFLVSNLISGQSVENYFLSVFQWEREGGPLPVRFPSLKRFSAAIAAALLTVMPFAPGSAAYSGLESRSTQRYNALYAACRVAAVDVLYIAQNEHAREAAPAASPPGSASPTWVAFLGMRTSANSDEVSNMHRTCERWSVESESGCGLFAVV